MQEGALKVVVASRDGDGAAKGEDTAHKDVGRGVRGPARAVADDDPERDVAGGPGTCVVGEVDGEGASKGGVGEVEDSLGQTAVRGVVEHGLDVEGGPAAGGNGVAGAVVRPTCNSGRLRVVPPLEGMVSPVPVYDSVMVVVGRTAPSAWWMVAKVSSAVSTMYFRIEARLAVFA